ncbi:putative thioredoxin 2 [Gammaproteobacteria bacterium]
MATIDLTKENFEQTINDNEMLILDFWAPWCAPCRSFKPIFEKVAEKHPEVVFCKINTEAERELAGYFQIRSIPTIMIFRQKVIVYSEAGALSESALNELVEQVKALDMEQVHKDIAEQEAANS